MVLGVDSYGFVVKMVLDAFRMSFVSPQECKHISNSYGFVVKWCWKHNSYTGYYSVSFVYHLFAN